MIPLLIVTIIERFAFRHSHHEVNTSSSSVIYALIIFTLTCGVIIIICYFLEKPDKVTIDIAKANDDAVPTYYNEWKDEDAFSLMCLIYGAISLIGLYLISNAAIKGEAYLHYFKKYAIILIIIDLIITILMKREIAPNVPCSIVGMIHFETSYMLRAVWMIAFIWGVFVFSAITILIGALILFLLKW